MPRPDSTWTVFNLTSALMDCDASERNKVNLSYSEMVKLLESTEVQRESTQRLAHLLLSNPRTRAQILTELEDALTAMPELHLIHIVKTVEFLDRNGWANAASVIVAAMGLDLLTPTQEEWFLSPWEQIRQGIIERDSEKIAAQILNQSVMLRLDPNLGTSLQGLSAQWVRPQITTYMERVAMELEDPTLMPVAETAVNQRVDDPFLRMKVPADKSESQKMIEQILSRYSAKESQKDDLKEPPGFNDALPPLQAAPKEEEGQKPEPPSPEVEAPLEGVLLKVFSPSMEFISNMMSRQAEREVAERNKKLLKMVQKHDGYRMLLQLPEDWAAQLATLKQDFPNFDDFLQELEHWCVLAEVGDRVVRMPPICLDGPPGVGKSLLANRLSGTFFGGFHRVAMASMEVGSALSGSSSHWSNTQTGAVFQKLCHGDYANPCFVLDEIDKLSSDYRHSPEAPLYDLLEPTAAKKFKDNSYPVEFDASRIVWLATANDFDGCSLSPAIKHRFMKIYVPEPTSEQMPSIIRSVFKGVQSESTPFDKFSLSEDAVDAIREMSPRRIRLGLQRACAMAARDKVFLIGPDHLPVSLTLPQGKSRRMGFTG